MALKIKKNIKQQDGTIIELEGTEAEIEAWEKKQAKRQKSENIKQEKTILYGKDLLKNIRKIIVKEIAKRPSQIIYTPYAQPSIVYPEPLGPPLWCNPLFKQEPLPAPPLVTITTADNILPSGNSYKNMYTCNAGVTADAVKDFSMMWNSGGVSN